MAPLSPWLLQPEAWELCSFLSTPCPTFSWSVSTVDFSSKSSLNFIFLCILRLYPSLNDYVLLLRWTMTVILLVCWPPVWSPLKSFGSTAPSLHRPITEAALSVYNTLCLGCSWSAFTFQLQITWVWVQAPTLSLASCLANNLCFLNIFHWVGGQGDWMDGWAGDQSQRKYLGIDLWSPSAEELVG